MKPGDPFSCPHCKHDTFLKKESVMDGWVKRGEVLQCAACSATIAEWRSPAETEAEKRKTASSSLRLQALLGEKPPEKPKISLSDADRRFCKDCRSAVRHPFHLMCSRFDRETEAMADCPSYEPRDPEA